MVVCGGNGWIRSAQPRNGVAAMRSAQVFAALASRVGDAESNADRDRGAGLKPLPQRPGGGFL